MVTVEKERRDSVGPSPRCDCPFPDLPQRLRGGKPNTSASRYRPENEHPDPEHYGDVVNDKKELAKLIGAW
jgi:hypothetical protein